MSNGDTSNKVDSDQYAMSEADWARLVAMTDEQVTAAALEDPDAQPLTLEQVAALQRPSVARVVRQNLRMSRDSFAAAYAIPLETLVAWERHEIVPTPTELAYLQLIAREPELAKTANLARAS
ncbi:MAG: transcriptional regulator [Hyphomicrobium aestuarii]|nr:transcriptional regulator [Hyphomicrobium aestuarii]